MLCITTSLMTVQESRLGPGNCRLERSKSLHSFMLLIVTVLSKSYLVHCTQVFIPVVQDKSFQIQNLSVSQLHRPAVHLCRQNWNTATLSTALAVYIFLAWIGRIHLPLARCWAPQFNFSSPSHVLPLWNRVFTPFCSALPRIQALLLYTN